jgi:putative DNA primase/helicase
MSPLTPISEIQMRPVEYLVEPFLPIGKLTDVAGQMGQGKSLLTEHWAAAVTTCRGTALTEPSSVLMFAAEDDAADTIRPRLEAAGADVSRIYVIEDDAIDVELIDAYCDEIQDVRLVTVDPLTGFFPKGVDAWNTPQVRRFLRPLIDLAQRRRFALLGVQHVNRRTDSDPLSRIADAQGIPQVARSVLVWGPDPEDPDGDGGDRKVLATAKNNLTKGRPAASFRIEGIRITDDIYAPKLVHMGESNAEAGDLVADQEARSQTQDAVNWLTDLLSDGPVEVGEAKKAAGDIGITPKCLRSARERIATHSRPGGNHGPYVWTLRPSHSGKRAFTGNQSKYGGIQEGIHGDSEGNHESVNAQTEAWMPVDARGCPDARTNGQANGNGRDSLTAAVQAMARMPETDAERAYARLTGSIAGVTCKCGRELWDGETFACCGVEP